MDKSLKVFGLGAGGPEKHVRRAPEAFTVNLA